jgi:hypothetical protein
LATITSKAEGSFGRVGCDTTLYAQTTTSTPQKRVNSQTLPIVRQCHVSYKLQGTYINLISTWKSTLGSREPNAADVTTTTTFNTLSNVNRILGEHSKRIHRTATSVVDKTSP